MIKSAPAATQTRNTVVEPTGRMVLPQVNRMDSVRPFRSLRDFESLKLERARLDTFSLAPGWPVSFIPPEDCAKAGFFFLQDGDKVQCAFCRGVAGEWEEGDNPSAEHRRHFPRCPFVCNLPVGNVPVGEEEETAQIREQEEAVTGIDVCGPFAPVTRITQQESSSGASATVRGAQPLNGNMSDVATSLAIKVCGNGPVHSSLVTLQSRIKTFAKWPSHSGQTSDTLAEAGFFYIGRMDHVKCFYCDGGLRNWEKEDDPWLEHARWFPKCSFVVLNKGDSYVKEVLKAKPTVAPPLFLNKVPALPMNSPRRVTDQELRDLIDTPIVQAALEMGMELGKVKGALQRKMQQTGQPFLTTESLLDAVLSRDPEYESDRDTDDDDEVEEEDTISRRRSNCPLKALNISRFNGSGSVNTSEAGSSSGSSGEFSSGSDEESQSPTTTMPRLTKLPASRTPSGDSDSGVSTAASESEEMQPLVSEMTNPPLLNDSPVEMAETPTNRVESESMDVDVQSPSDSPSKKIESECKSNVTSNSTEKEEKQELSMEEELRKLREVTQCKICMDNKVEVVFLPCGHLVSCTRCATAFSSCAVCRQPIKAYVKTYLS